MEDSCSQGHWSPMGDAEGGSRAAGVFGERRGVEESGERGKRGGRRRTFFSNVAGVERKRMNYWAVFLMQWGNKQPSVNYQHTQGLFQRTFGKRSSNTESALAEQHGEHWRVFRLSGCCCWPSPTLFLCLCNVLYSRDLKVASNLHQSFLISLRFTTCFWKNICK